VTTIPALPDGWALVQLDDIDSTNAEALRRAQKGLRGLVWIQAKSQNSGRGRQGRPWVSKPGNLYCSLLLSDNLQMSTLAQVGFVAGLAVHDAAERCLRGTDGNTELALKWPNDLILNDAKVAGILLESTNVPATGLVLAVGIGLNVRHSPPRAVTMYETTDLAAHGATGDVHEAFEHLAQAFAEWYAEWDHGAGFARIRQDWMIRAHRLGQTVTVNMPDGKVSGRFSGLDNEGAMMLKLKDGEDRRILAGDVVAANPARTNARQ